MINALTIDLEDWRQSTFNNEAPITERVVENTKKILDIFAETNTKATFFCLGLVAEKYPQLIKDIHNQGHEISTHGWSHGSVKEMGADKFKQELTGSIRILEDICGVKVLGHRAPNFSIDLETEWAFEIIAELGLIYDSSLFPIKGKRYGSPECSLKSFHINKNLVEIPLTALDFGGRRWPVLGGGYFRLYPYLLSSYFLRKINRDGRPAVVYIHPHEVDTQDLKKGDIPYKIRFHQGLFRYRIAARLKKLLSDFKFDSIQKVFKFQ